jgi:hypothetical protein
MHIISEPNSNKSSDSTNSIPYIERKKKIEEVMDKIKRKIGLLVSKQNAIDIRDIKLYHKLYLECKHNFYITPMTSNKNSADINSKEGSEEGQNSNSDSKSNIDYTYKEKETNAFLPPAMRLISPYNKEFTCNCKRNQCKKNYCDCRKNKEMCDPRNCSCEDCDNQF